MGNWRKQAKKTGEAMLSVGWGVSFTIATACGLGGTTLVAVRRFIEAAESSEPLDFLILLFQYSFFVLLVILAFGIGIKALMFYGGRFLLWISDYYPKGYFQPTMHYSWKPKGDEYYLSIKSSPKNEKVSLHLTFLTPEMKGLVSDNARSEIEQRFLSFSRKKIVYENLGIPSGAELESSVPIAKIENRNLFLIVMGMSLYIPPGKYFYRLSEEGDYRGRGFGSTIKIDIEFTKEDRLII